MNKINIRKSIKILICFFTLIYISSFIFADEIIDETKKWKYELSETNKDIIENIKPNESKELLTGEVEIPKIIDGKKVVSICKSAFADYYNITKIIIPETIDTINSYAFENCCKLENFEVVEENTKYTSKDGVLFSKDMHKIIAYPIGRKDTEYTVPEEVRLVGEGCFKNQETLKIIYLPTFLVKIEESAFENMDNLQTVNLKDMGYALTNISSKAFYNCTNFRRIEIPEITSEVAANAFHGCNNVYDITIVSGNGSFYLVGGNIYSKNREKLVMYSPSKTDDTFEVPKGTKELADELFYENSNLSTIIIPSSVNKIGKGTFANIEKLEKIKISFMNKTYRMIDENVYTKKGNELVQYIEDYIEKEIILPKNTKSIYSKAIYDTSLEKINVPSKVNTIKAEAFKNNESLKEVGLASNLKEKLEINTFKRKSLEKIKLYVKKEYLDKNPEIYLANKTKNGYETILMNVQIVPYNFYVNVDGKCIYVTEKEYKLPEVTDENGNKMCYKTSIGVTYFAGKTINKDIILTTKTYNIPLDIFIILLTIACIVSIIYIIKKYGKKILLHFKKTLEITKKDLSEKKNKLDKKQDELKNKKIEKRVIKKENRKK